MKRTYFLDRWRADLADAVDVVVEVALVAASERLRPQFGSAEMSVRVLDAFDVGPLPDQAQRHVQRRVLQLVRHRLAERVHVHIGLHVRLRVRVEDVARSVVYGVQVRYVTPLSHFFYKFFQWINPFIRLVSSLQSTCYTLIRLITIGLFGYFLLYCGWMLPGTTFSFQRFFIIKMD